MKKVLVIVIATILALSVIGTCFALYKINATDRNITLTTGDAVTLSIAAGDLAEVGISPDHTTATYNVKLESSSTVSDASVYGKFTVATSGTLANYLKVSTTINTEEKDDAALKKGVYYALNALPTTFTLTFTFDFSGIDFYTVAETVANVTLSWVIDSSYTGTYKPVTGGYYLVGKINGKESWAPASDDHKFTTAVADPKNKAELEIALSAGDTVKIKNGATWYPEWGNWKDYETIGTLDSNGNLVITAAGTYNFYLNQSNEVYVVKKTANQA